jgi:sugar lactone lactonase YvrE
LDGCRGSQDPGREHECGRPLGLKFNRETGELYVADAYHGLRVVGPDDLVSRPLVPPEWQGSRRPFSFANGVEIDYETGAVYFTETSTRFQRRWKSHHLRTSILFFLQFFSPRQSDEFCV